MAHTHAHMKVVAELMGLLITAYIEKMAQSYEGHRVESPSESRREVEKNAYAQNTLHKCM